MIPSELGNLANLTHLFLSDNRFSEYMPTSLLGRLNMGFSDLCGLQFCRGSVSDVLSATPAAHRVTSHASPSPRATGAHFHVGRGMPRAVSNPAASKERCSPPHSSNQASSPRLTSPPRDAVPSGPSHDRRVRNAGPGADSPCRVAGNSPVYSHGCKLPQPVAERVAGKPGCRTSGRILYIRYSSQGCVGMTL